MRSPSTVHFSPLPPCFFLRRSRAANRHRSGSICRLESAAARAAQDHPRRLPQPNPAEAVNNTAHVIPRPADSWPIAPAGFKPTLYAGGDPSMQRADNKEFMTLSGGTFTMPRLIRTAPNGDLFLADSGAGTIFILRGMDPTAKPRRSKSLRPAWTIHSGSPFILLTAQSTSMLAMPRQYSGFLTTPVTCTRRGRPKRSFLIFLATLSSPAEVTGRATLSSLKTAGTCSSPLAPAPM